VVTIQTDVARPEAVARLVAQVKHRWGRIDVLVNNAGIASVTPFQRLRVAEWDTVLAVNLRGAFLCCQRVAPIMTSQRCGSIVMIASQAGQTGGAFVGAHYAVSKAGLICLTKYLAKELASSRIRVNCVAPGIIDTDMARAFPRRALRALVQRVPLGRLGMPEEVAKAVAFLASEESAYMTGVTIPVNGGLWMP
jgi:3-oxoacyl-[acyl-carrier protein] reductase